ncbi:MAG: cytochrome P450 [Chloroflexota bacterium]
MPGTTDVLKRFTSIMRDPLSFLLEMSQSFGDSVPFNLPDEKARLINHPDLIEYVLLTNNRNYSKKTPQFETFAYVAGNGLLNSDGSFWLRQRRIAQPAFHRRKINQMIMAMQSETEKKLTEWRALSSGTVVDMEQEMLQLTLGITMKSLFNMDISGQEAEMVKTIEETLGYVMFRAQVMVPIPPTWPLPVNRRFQKAMRTLDAFVYQMIEDRRQSTETIDDVLSIFISATDEDGKPLPDELIRDEILTLIIAGYETAASGMTWLWALLAENADIFQNVRNELAEVLNGRSPTLEDLPNLPYLKQTIQEGWRLYPPSWVITRAAIEDDVIGGEPIAAGTLVIISPYTMHRHPTIWPDPNTFNPERFKRENERPRYAFIPFGGGPRLCIGHTFAEMETMVIMGTLAQHFYPQPVAQPPHKTRALVTIRPKDGLPVTLQK